jgi:NAD(P)-dependent dehydrogenase (short-subunit alcohol dehydrogenase family)
MMAGMREQFQDDSQIQLPQQRMARPEEVGDLIAFLMSAKATYVSGSVIPVDGGLTAHSAGMPFPKLRDPQS